MTPNGLRFSGAAPVDGEIIVADTGAEKCTISLDAKRRPLQARVGHTCVTDSCEHSRQSAFELPCSTLAFGRQQSADFDGVASESLNASRL